MTNATRGREGSSTVAQPDNRVRWPRLDHVLELVSSTIARVCTWAITALLFVMLASVTYQVVARYWVKSVVGGPEEVARLCMIAMVFLGLPVLAHLSENIRLDVAQELLKNARTREWLVRVALAAELVFFVILTVLAYEFVDQLLHSQQQTPALGIRLVWSRAPVLVGSALAALVGACVLTRRLLGSSPTGAHQISVNPL